MPTLNWIGKEAVVNHHHAVPFHLLKDVPELAAGDPGSGNLIVQGDNLVALKALLPHYAGQVKCIYIDPDESSAWLDGVLSKMQPALALGRLVRERFELRRKFETRIGELRKAARQQEYQRILFGGDSQTKVRVGGGYNFAYDPNTYPCRMVCPRSREFLKHYYENVGDLDDETNREEFLCAMKIDGLDAVEWWVRNIDRQPVHSFWLQTSTDKFYPDFVCKLKGGKILVVEYKGLDRATNDDTKEKERLGNLWAERSGGQCLFLMVKGPGELSRITDAVAKAAN